MSDATPAAPVAERKTEAPSGASTPAPKEGTLTDDFLRQFAALSEKVEALAESLDGGKTEEPRREPTKLELSQAYAKDFEMTDKVTEEQAVAYFPNVDGSYMNHAIRGPYIVCVFSNGRKYAEEHKLEGVKHVSRSDPKSKEVV